MRGLRDFLPELALGDALVDELSDENEWLPTPFLDAACAGHVDVVEGAFTARAARGAPLAPMQVIAARKVRHGTRPAAVLGLFERTLYRSLVTASTAEIVGADRDADSYRAFLEAPLAVPGTEYVLETDIASFYEYVDHERLETELLAQGTAYDIAELVVSWLQEVSARRFGLPQTIGSSHPLGEIYIDVMERRLLREGHVVFRYADDFRVALPDWDGVLRATDALSDAARALGLVLNDAKTYTPRLSTYRDIISRPEELMREVSESAEADLTGWNEYFDEAEPPEESEVRQEAAHQLLHYWMQESEEDDVQRQREAQVTSRLLGQALGVMTALADPFALGATTAVLAYEPVHTARLGRYLAAVSGSQPGSVEEAVRTALELKGLSQWQHLWLLWVAVHDQGLRFTGTSAIATWAERLTGHHWNDHVRAMATVLLAQQGLRTLADCSALLGDLDAGAARDTTVAAMTLAAGGDLRRLRAVRGASELDRLVSDWAAENLVRR
jgi:hypothetical protein